MTGAVEMIVGQIKDVGQRRKVKNFFGNWTCKCIAREGCDAQHLQVANARRKRSLKIVVVHSDYLKQC